MSELSVFADESGDTGDDSRLYLLTLVFHDQAETLKDVTRLYETSLKQSGLDDIPFHMQPLLNREGDYEGLEIGNRMKLLDRFHAYTTRCPVQHDTLVYDKKEFGDFKAEIPDRMARDIEALVKTRYSYILSFDQVKIYYDNGQAEVTKSLHESFESALASNVPVFKSDVNYRSFRLCQVADMICGFEFLARKFEHGFPVEPSNTDLHFFDSFKDLRKRYLKKLSKMRFSNNGG